jgi:hypothetical protein
VFLGPLDVNGGPNLFCSAGFKSAMLFCLVGSFGISDKNRCADASLLKPNSIVRGRRGSILDGLGVSST